MNKPSGETVASALAGAIANPVIVSVPVRECIQTLLTLSKAAMEGQLSCAAHQRGELQQGGGGG